MPCPICRDRRLVEIKLAAGGSELTMRNCSQCETKWWERDGERVELDNVIDTAGVSS